LSAVVYSRFWSAPRSIVTGGAGLPESFTVQARISIL
jgi:hypothetical protein